MQPYLMISNRNKDGDVFGTDLAAIAFFTADPDVDPASLTKFSGWTRVTRQAFLQQLKQIASEFPQLPDEQHESQRHMCLFVHGYNVTWDDAVGDYLRVKNQLIEPENLGQLVLYSWPSKGSVAGYLPDREDARDSAPDLAQLLVDLYNYLIKNQNLAASSDDPKLFCRAKFSIIAHSMGNYVIQNALAIAAKRLNSPQLISLINQLVMVAADVDNDLFQRDKPDDSDGSLMANLCYRIGALFTGLDAVLGMSAGLKHFGTRRLGRSGLADRNNVWDNVFDFDVTNYIDTDESIHSAVFDSPRAIEITRRILRGVDRNFVNQGV